MGDESISTMPCGGIEATAQPQQTAPSWLAEAVVLARTIWSTWALLPLCETVRVARGRTGLYDVCDFVLVLLAYAVSKAATLATFFARAAPVPTLFMAAWEHVRMPSASALSRFLSAVTATSAEQLRTLFLRTWRPTG